MTDRRGEQFGWLGGWMGGFIWVLIVSVILFIKGLLLQGAIGVLIFFAAWIVIYVLAPWRHPKTAYRKLLIGPYVAFLVSIAWGLWAYGGPGEMGLSWWSVLWLLPISLPLWLSGGRCWESPPPQAGSDVK